MSYFESLSLPEKIHYFIVMCPGRACAALLCLCFSLLALALVVQYFIPPLRRLYVAVFRWGLQLVGIRQQVQEYASLLAAWLARLGFASGFCLIPICLGFYADAASHYSGPMPMSYLFVFGPIAFLLMILAFIIVSLWAFIAWRKLRRKSKQA